MSDPMIRGTLGANVQFQANADLMSAYEMAEKDRLDRQANQEFWENQGEKKGRKEGRKEGRSELILNLLDSGMTPDQIANSAKVPISEVEELTSKRQ